MKCSRISLAAVIWLAAHSISCGAPGASHSLTDGGGEDNAVSTGGSGGTAAGSGGTVPVGSGGGPGTGGASTGTGGDTGIGGNRGGNGGAGNANGATGGAVGSGGRGGVVGSGGTVSSGGTVGSGGVGGRGGAGGRGGVVGSGGAVGSGGGCGAGQTMCTSGCATLSTDAKNCKTCGTVCAAPTAGTGTAVCGASGCDLMCSGSTSTKCGTACRDVATDINNCRACGTICPAPTAGTGTAVCGAAGCDLSCTGATSTKCGTACRNVASDITNCRTCGTICPAPSAGTGTAVCGTAGCDLSCTGTTNTKCGGACVALTTPQNCGGCNVVCHGNAQCLAGTTSSCVCNKGYAGTGTACALENECTTGNHRCGSGTCSNGAVLGYTCACPSGWTLETGTFPQCYKSGTITFSMATSFGYDFMAATPTSYSGGDFYTSDLAEPPTHPEAFHTFYANNIDQQGVVAVSNMNGVPLTSVTIPSTGYTRFGVNMQVGGTYVSYAKSPHTNYYIVMRVTALPVGAATLSWALVYRPPGSL